jgi:predicted PolB exonuclease-like 3'-5' exonuclease
MNTLVFDIETVPDVDLGRRLYNLAGLPDADVMKAMFTLRRQGTGGSEFLPHDQHRIVTISCVLRANDVLKVWSLGNLQSTEQELVERFFYGIERYTPCLVSWNGSGFDLPVLHYRALKYGVRAARYWETGGEDQTFRYNNYLGRYHWRHIDVMDVLSGYQSRAKAGLEAIATMLGLPGKLGFSGEKVADAYLAGELLRIRQYCETDVINTYLVYIRFELMRGNLIPERYAEEVERMKALLRAGVSEPHFAEYLRAWEAQT